MSSTTGTGIAVPDGDDSPDVPRDVLAMAHSLDDALVYTFSSTGQRDSTYGARPFKACWVGDTLYVRSGSNWLQVYPQKTGFGGAQGSSTADQNVAAGGSWTRMNLLTTDLAESGSGLTVGVSGIGVTYPGRYWVTAFCQIQSGGGGTYRQIGIGTGSSAPSRVCSYPPIGSSGAQMMSITTEVSASAGDVVKIFSRHDSGSIRLSSERLLQVRRVS